MIILIFFFSLFIGLNYPLLFNMMMMMMMMMPMPMDSQSKECPLLFKLLGIVFKSGRLCGSNQHIGGTMQIILPARFYLVKVPSRKHFVRSLPPLLHSFRTSSCLQTIQTARLFAAATTYRLSAI